MSELTVREEVREAPIRALRITVVEGPDLGQTFTSSSDVVAVGSAPGNDLVLTDDKVSRYHLELRPEGERILVADLGSTNGTWAASARIERGSVGRGTTLRLGGTRIVVEDVETTPVPLYPGYELSGIRGRTPEMRRLMAQIVRIASSDASVLLLGETGTGKELVARAIHLASPRAERPFEVVDCGTLVPALIASELFGHERGAFTGATDRHVGAFERADGGTVFLDEIGELPPQLQTQLLGALERRSFRPVGGSRPVSVDVRVVAATHRDLRQGVNSGEFRQDLYFRLAVVRLGLPALRERVDDIPLLVEHFLRELAPERSPSELIPSTVVEQLKTYHWPGNIRELRNFVHSVLALGEVPKVEVPGHRGEGDGAAAASAKGPSIALGDLLHLPYHDARDRVFQDFQEAYLRALLERSGDNLSQAARDAQMNRTHLLELLKRHRLK